MEQHIAPTARDVYRAWYGLGQAYEILGLLQFSSYYYSQAAALCPRDGRLWVALGGVFERIGRVHDAIMCYERAQVVPERYVHSVSSADLARHSMWCWLCVARGQDHAHCCWTHVLPRLAHFAGMRQVYSH